MNRNFIISNIKKKKSFLCVGLDTDIKKIPKFLLDYSDPIFEFNKRIIDSTKNYCISYKLNLAFYEYYGSKGYDSLVKTLNYIPKDIFKIADAKRGDIGNSSKMYAKSFFEYLNFDAITLSPYMGMDSIIPFLEYKNKWVILLSLTSNIGAKDFQLLKFDEFYLFEKIIEISSKWGNIDNLMYVIGANRSNYFNKIRKLIPNHFLLIPGLGFQGGKIEEIVKNNLNNDIGLIVNSSRKILYSSNDNFFQKIVAEKTLDIQKKMEKILLDNNII